MPADFDNTAPESVALTLAKWADVRFALTAGGTDPLDIAEDSEVDGVTAEIGDRFVCVGERPDAGIYVVGESASTRATDANAAGEFTSPRGVRVLEGSDFNVGLWIHRTDGAITLDTTDLTFSYLTAEPETLPSGGFNNTAPTAVDLG